jgi:predicted ATPase
MIKSVIVEGLRGIEGGRASFELQPGLNILTGKNGSGKTTMLKFIWYLISGNVEQALLETPFAFAKISTDTVTIEIDNRPTDARVYRITDEDGEQTELRLEFDEDGDPVWYGGDDDPDDFANAIMSNSATSLFFPTFRRIEGGFGITRRTNRINPIRLGSTKPSTSVEAALEEVSRKLSNLRHTFVCSVSTLDIANILIQKYTDISEQSNSLQTSTSQKIIDRIRVNNRLSDAEAEPSDSILQEILRTIEASDLSRERLFAPIEAVRSVVIQIFQSKAISFGQRLNFGDAATAVASDVLSAGEKQMLSFICYNALYSNASIFIDEPELSLHVDWQRLLFSTLDRQQTNNQFIIATHSPFIYAKYPDREIQISSLRGDEADL